MEPTRGAEASLVRAVTYLALAAGVALLAVSIGLGLRDRGEQQRASDQALTSKAADQATRLEEYFARARSIMLITAQNPSFRSFYSDPGSRREKIEARTPAVRESEKALAYLETLYPASIGEACFIDRSGPENARYVRGRKATIADLSPDETGSPFFAPTFALRAGEVFQATPYVSPDTGEWVISNSTPVPGTGYPAAAIVHFEVTVESFRRTAAAIAKQDDVAVVDAKTGQVILDSRFAQKLGRPLGRPSDMRFAGLVSSGAVSGNGTVDEHRVALSAAFAGRPQCERLVRGRGGSRARRVAHREHRLGHLGMAAAALALLVLAALSYRSSRRRLEEDELARAAEERRAASERAHYEAQREFTEIMQVTRDEGEAYGLLKRHLERSLDGSDVLVLNRNNSHDRLEPVTGLPDGSDARGTPDRSRARLVSGREARQDPCAHPGPCTSSDLRALRGALVELDLRAIARRGRSDRFGTRSTRRVGGPREQADGRGVDHASRPRPGEPTEPRALRDEGAHRRPHGTPEPPRDRGHAQADGRLCRPSGQPAGNRPLRPRPLQADQRSLRSREG